MVLERRSLLAQETVFFPANESHEKTALETCIQQVCIPLQRIWLKHPAGFSPETTAHGIQVFPR